MTIAPPSPTAPGAGTFLFEPGDIDGDGDQDLVVRPISGWFLGVTVNQSLRGSGCPGTGAILPQSLRCHPTPGNAGFALGVSLPLTPAAPAVLGLSTGTLPGSGSCQVLIDPGPQSLLLPQGGLGILSTDAFGQAFLPLPIPSDPTLSGLVLHNQWAVQDPQAPAGFALSQARKIILW